MLVKQKIASGLCVLCRIYALQKIFIDIYDEIPYSTKVNLILLFRKATSWFYDKCYGMALCVPSV